ncbi:LacI family transcriptional regulator [Povalibacter uvarum]|uniref:LacI family transcriptional regulator n=2 Tax=Povalibacter uvarum TaxID=732238 RepID=A0A841HJP1_9GAMM|nr:LacI family transcriptional regulator [Povalibacter uvarum]
MNMVKKAAKKASRKVPVSTQPAAASQVRHEEPTRKHTINDIARLANVSKKTVSRVINESPFVREDTRTRIAEIMQRVGYTPDPQARGLAFRRSFLIGLIYDNPNAPYVINIQEGALGALRRQGYELVVHPCDRTNEKFLSEIRELISRQKLDGVIMLPPVSENSALAEMLQKLNCPYVRVLAAPLDEPQNLVLSMDRQSAAEVAEHLWKLGHKRISMIIGPQTYRSSIERLTGFSDALAERGLTMPPEFVVEGLYTFESGAACAELLLSRNPRPTAIFAGNDETAAGVYRTAYLRGLKIPDDLTVVGFDDSPLASRLCPSLTTMRQPIRDMGRLAAERVMAKIAGLEGPPLTATTFFPHLVVRESSGRPKT